MIKNIIFDWSGVIDDNAKTVYQASMGLIKRLGGRPISFQKFRQIWQQPYMLFYNKFLPDLTLQEEKRFFDEEMAKLPKSKAHPGIRKVLMDFKAQKITMVILSGDRARYINQKIKEYQLENLFNEIYDDVHNKIEVIRNIILNHKFKENETIFIGDTIHEIEAGKHAGLKTAGVTWGFDDEEKLKSARPDFIVHNLNELRKVILE